MVLDIFVIKIDQSPFRFDGVDQFKFGQGGIRQRLKAFEMLAADSG